VSEDAKEDYSESDDDLFADEAHPKRRTKKRRRQRVNPQSLERWAVHHLGRYSSSASNLGWVLKRRVRRIEQAQEESFPEASEWIAATVADLIKGGYLDDRKYARAIAVRMRERGLSARRIESHLSGKGVSWEISRETVEEVSGKGEEFEAALRYARRRRLGPFRLDPDVREERRQRDLAALGRSGFSYGIASRIIEAECVETLESRVTEQD